MSDAVQRPLKWSHQLDILPATSTPTLKGDKIILPPSALEQLLSAATVTVTSIAQPQTSSFDLFNPYSYAAERHARQQIVERQQQLPHPLTFRLVNPENSKVVFAGIREFSAPDETVGLSPFLRQTLGIDGDGEGNQKGHLNGVHASDALESNQSDLPLGRLTVHVQELSKGTYVKLRPLEAGYDPEDWKALLEQYLRDTFTTLTDQEVIEIPAGKDTFRFLVDGLKPDNEAVSLVDTDLEVDIEPLNEEQARETLQKLAQKSQRAPGTKDGSSTGGNISVDENETGQVRPGDYVDYSLAQWDKSMDLEVELSNLNGGEDVDVFVSPFSQKHRQRPREEIYVFGDMTSHPIKRLRISHTNAELDNAEALRVSVHGYISPEADGIQQPPLQYSLRMSSNVSASIDPSSQTYDEEPIAADEERCTNCHQPVPKRTMFLHQNFCLRNNILCPHCHGVFQKSSAEWQNHWHCPHDSSHGNTPSSKIKHDSLFHKSAICPSCSYTAANVPSLAHHRSTICPGKLILCQFCHLQVPQQGPDDPSPDSADVILSGLTPHELSDGARTTECHLCSKIVRLRDMSAHLRHHDLQRLSRSKPKICRNVNCGRAVNSVTKTGEVRHQAARNELGLCDICFGPLYVSMYDPDGKALKRRVERKYLTQLLTGCNQAWCMNGFCKTGRQHLGLTTDGESLTSKESLQMIKPILDGLVSGSTSLHLCMDEASQRRRTIAEMMAAEGDGDIGGGKGKGKEKERSGDAAGYDVEWCVAALEVEGGDLEKARAWLKGFAPTRAETG